MFYLSLSSVIVTIYIYNKQGVDIVIMAIIVSSFMNEVQIIITIKMREVQIKHLIVIIIHRQIVMLLILK